MRGTSSDPTLFFRYRLPACWSELGDYRVDVAIGYQRVGGIRLVCACHRFDSDIAMKKGENIPYLAIV